MKNIGHSVAVNVEVHYGLFLQSFANSEKFFEVIEKQKSICERGRNDKKLAKTRFTMFPEEEVKDNLGSSISKEEIAARIVPSKSGRKVIAAYLVGCVDYAFSFQEGHHGTGFIYQVSRYDPARPSLMLPFEVGKDVPAENVLLTKYYFGGELID